MGAGRNQQSASRAAGGGGHGHVVSLPRSAQPSHRLSPSPSARCRPSLAGVVEAGWTHAAGMLYRKYQIAMGGHILDPTEASCTACRSAAQLEAVSSCPCWSRRGGLGGCNHLLHCSHLLHWDPTRRPNDAAATTCCATH